MLTWNEAQERLTLFAPYGERGQKVMPMGALLNPSSPIFKYTDNRKLK